MTNKYTSEEILNNLQKASSYYQEIMSYLMQHNNSADMILGTVSNEKNVRVAQIIYQQLATHPEKFTKISLDYIQKFQQLVSDSTHKFIGSESIVNTKKAEEDRVYKQHQGSDSTENNTNQLDQKASKDKRFKDPAWKHNVFFDFVKKYYLLNSEWVAENLKQLELDSHQQDYVEFMSKQFIDALSPSNFLFSNPEVIRESLDSGMGNIAHGLQNFLEDLKQSTGPLNISTTDKSKFRVGKNLAATEGKVIYENELAQLICYKPQGRTHKTPVFIIPPWINKYYILDLSENNSFVKWLVDNNYQVYLVSWANPDEKLAHKDFEDYLQEGILDMIIYMQKLGIHKVNAVGYCIGGTLLACALSYLQGKKNQFINSATFLTTLIDFSKPGDISAFINEQTAEIIEKEVNSKGYLDGKYISNSFGLIRANDLIWSFFINNYLLGKTPAAFDILYWNSDSTNLPAKMYMFYLKNMYLKNQLMTKDGISLLGEKINIQDIEIDSFSLAAKGDHIALWDGVYLGYKLIGGHKTFCLTEAGHVAGIVNPATNKKYAHHISSDLNGSAQDWLINSELKQGSWWNSWEKWLNKKSGPLEDSIVYEKLDYIEKSPGGYVYVTNS